MLCRDQYLEGNLIKKSDEVYKCNFFMSDSAKSTGATFLTLISVSNVKFSVM